MKKFLLLIPTLLGAMNSFYPIGYGTSAKGMGGVGIAIPQDTLAVATNPAGLVYLGNRIDAGFGWIGFDGNFSRTQSPIPALDGRFSSSESVWYPEIGTSILLWPNVSVGLAYYLNGAFSVDTDVAIPSFGTSSFESHYRQYALTPFLSIAIDGTHLVGVSIPIAYGTVKFNGLENFIPLSIDPARVTGRGSDTHWGAGVRVGWVGCFFDMLSAGFTFQTPIWMGRFSDYAGFLPNRGDFDAPARAGGGIAFFGYPCLLLALDVEYIFNNDVRAFGCNALSLNPFGSKPGPGLGWNSSWVFKLGASYEIFDNFIFRFGYNWGESPLDANNAFFNALSLATPEHHITLGGSFYWGCHELSFSYIHAFENRVHGPINSRFVGGKATLNNQSNHISVSYGLQI